MIGTATYTLTSFEIIMGGIVVYVLGAFSAFTLVGYGIWRICNKVESKKNSNYNSEQDYKVE